MADGFQRPVAKRHPPIPFNQLPFNRLYFNTVAYFMA